MRPTPVSVLVLSAVLGTVLAASRAAALDLDCGKVLDRANLLQVDFEELRTTTERDGGVKTETKSRTNRYLRDATGGVSAYSYGPDGRRTGLSHSNNGRPHFQSVLGDKGERRIETSYADSVDAPQLAGRRDFEVRSVVTSYASEADKEGRREGHLVQYRYVGEQEARVGPCTYAVLAYETKGYRFDGRQPPMLTTARLHYAPALPLILWQVTRLYDGDTVFATFENRATAMAADDPRQAKTP